MLVLHSTMSLSREQTTKTDRALQILQAKGIKYDTLDGAMASNKER